MSTGDIDWEISNSDNCWRLILCWGLSLCHPVESPALTHFTARVTQLVGVGLGSCLWLSFSKAHAQSGNQRDSSNTEKIQYRDPCPSGVPGGGEAGPVGCK